MSRWWANVAAGQCGRCGVPWPTVGHGGWRNTCEDCHAVLQRRSRRLVGLAQVLCVGTLVAIVAAVIVRFMG